MLTPHHHLQRPTWRPEIIALMTAALTISAAPLVMLATDRIALTLLAMAL